MKYGLRSIFGQNINYSTEIIAGITTFLTMGYIIFANSDILSVTGMDKTALMIVTCLVSGIITIMTGILSNSPIAMAPGMGLNAFFAYTIVITQKIDWSIALGIVFISGIFFLILSVVGLRKKIVKAIPEELLSAIAVGIGVFIAFIGLQNMGLIVKNEATLISAGKITGQVLVGLAGLLVMVILELRRIKGALLLGIFVATLLAVIFGMTSLPQQAISLDLDISPIFLKLDIIGALKISFIVPIFTLMFIDLFDSLGSLLGLAQDAGLKDEQGEIPVMSRLLSIDAGATIIGSLFGTSTTTTYMESASGISAGGRTGFTSMITGIMFIIAIIFVPILSIVPSFATAPALIMVGFFMMKNITRIDFSKIEIGFPSFIIIVMIALSYSISAGLAFGFLSYSLIQIFRGKISDIKPALWLINGLCTLYFVLV